MDFTIKEKPFSWNDNFSEVAQEDFSVIQKDLNYSIAQNIGMALAKLELLENQGCEVVEQKQGQWYPMHFGGVWQCSECSYLTNDNKATRYCPNCGAKMVKGTEE